MTPKPNTSSREGEVVHQYDDIQECDNHLPNWWLYTLYGAIVFALGYWFYFHVFAAGELPMQAWQRETKAAREKEGASIVVTDDQLLALSKDTARVAEGKAIFAQTCAVCHGPQGGGVIGPNLTDEYWLHGGRPQNIFTTIRDGVPKKAMVAWGPQLGAKGVQSVSAYVLTLAHTNVPGGKPPQGEKTSESEEGAVEREGSGPR